MRTEKAQPTTALHSRSRWYWFEVVALFCAIGLLIGGIVYMMLKTYAYDNQPVATKTDASYQEQISDSGYSGVRVRHVDMRNHEVQAQLDYPVTKWERLNNMVAAKLEAEYHEFVSEQGGGSRPGQQRATFAVHHQAGDIISLRVSVERIIDGKVTSQRQFVWTFNGADTKDGQPGRVIELRDLVADKVGAYEKLSAIVRKKAAQQTAEAKAPLLEAQSGQLLGADQNIGIVRLSAHSFGVIVNYRPLGWQEERSQIIEVAVADVMDMLQNDTARLLLDVPRPAPPEPAQLKPAATSAVAKGCGNCVAITFDDGPGQYTARLLDMLDRLQVRATFFAVGTQIDRYPQLVQRELQAGHTVASHTWNHPQLSTLADSQIQQQIDSTNDAMRRAINRPARYLRPPYGDYDDRVLKLLAARQMSAVLWNVDTRDWADHNSDLVCHRAVNGATPGSIILLHDIHLTSVNAVPCIVEGLRARGFAMVTIEQLLGQGEPGKVYRKAQ